MPEERGEVEDDDVSGAAASSAAEGAGAGAGVADCRRREAAVSCINRASRIVLVASLTARGWTVLCCVGTSGGDEVTSRQRATFGYFSFSFPKLFPFRNKLSLSCAQCHSKDARDDASTRACRRRRLLRRRPHNHHRNRRVRRG